MKLYESHTVGVIFSIMMKRDRSKDFIFHDNLFSFPAYYFSQFIRKIGFKKIDEINDFLYLKINIFSLPENV